MKYTDLCAQAGKALEGVTDGPWTLCAHLANDHENGCTCGYRGVIYAADTEYAICQPGHDVTPGEEGLEPPRRPRAEEVANARFIAFARAWVPAATAAIRDLEAQVRESAMQELASLGQAQEAYQAQLAAEAKVGELTRERNADGEYLIVKRGMYYRPNSQGYTSSPAEAGRYTLAQAVFITHPNGPDGSRDGMSYVAAAIRAGATP